VSRGQSQALGLRLAVLLLWVVAVAAVVGLLLSRLLAATVPPQSGPGIGSGVPAGVPQQAPYIYHYYSAPVGGGQATPYQ